MTGSQKFARCDCSDPVYIIASASSRRFLERGGDRYRGRSIELSIWFWLVLPDFLYLVSLNDHFAAQVLIGILFNLMTYPAKSMKGIRNI